MECAAAGPDVGASDWLSDLPVDACREADFVMVAEAGRWWRLRRGGCSVVVGTRTVLPSRRCTVGLVEIYPAAPQALGLGGDELRVRAGLRALGVEL